MIAPWSFILILMMSGSGRAIDHISGYSSYAECRSAGASLVSQEPKYQSAFFACVKTPPAQK